MSPKTKRLFYYAVKRLIAMAWKMDLRAGQEQVREYFKERLFNCSEQRKINAGGPFLVG